MTSFCGRYGCDDCSYLGLDCCQDLLKEDALVEYHEIWDGDEA